MTCGAYAALEIGFILELPVEAMPRQSSSCRFRNLTSGPAAVLVDELDRRQTAISRIV